VPVSLPAHRSNRPLWLPLVLLLTLVFGVDSATAQPAPSRPAAPSQSAKPAQSQAPPEAAVPADSGKLQARIDAAALALRNNPQFKNLSVTAQDV
jgi:hypothetical protein